jgi:hypothetical protein
MLTAATAVVSTRNEAEAGHLRAPLLWYWSLFSLKDVLISGKHVLA